MAGTDGVSYGLEIEYALKTFGRNEYLRDVFYFELRVPRHPCVRWGIRSIPWSDARSVILEPFSLGITGNARQPYLTGIFRGHLSPKYRCQSQRPRYSDSALCLEEDYKEADLDAWSPRANGRDGSSAWTQTAPRRWDRSACPHRRSDRVFLSRRIPCKLRKRYTSSFWAASALRIWAKSCLA